MKLFDFEQLGGFPLTQPELLHMQENVQEGFEGLLSGLHNRIILSGMVLTETPLTSTTRTVAISSGRCAMGGDIMWFSGDSQVLTDTQFPRIYSTYDSESLVFQNASSEPVKYTSKAVLSTTTGTLYTEFKRLPQAIADAGRGTWQTLIDTADATVKILVDKLAKVCHVRGECKHYSNNYASSGTFVPMQMSIVSGGLPVPAGAGNFYFSSRLETHTVPMQQVDDGVGGPGGIYYGETGRVTFGGGLSIGSRKLMGAVPGGKIHKFNFSYPID